MHHVKHIIACGVLLVVSAATPIARAQLVTFQLGSSSPLVDSSFFDGQPEDGSNVAGRFILETSVSNDATRVAIKAVNAATASPALFIVEVGEPTSWYRLTTDGFGSLFASPHWVPDDSAILYGNRRVDSTTGTVTTPTVHGFTMAQSSITRLSSNNWMAIRSANELWLMPVLPDGIEDLSRSPVQATTFFTGLSPRFLDGPSISHDGTTLAFDLFEQVTPPSPDLADMYVITGLGDFQDGTPPSPIAALADPRVVPISVAGNHVAVGRMSADNQYIFYSEDHNNVYQNDDFINSVLAGDWDAMIAPSDGSGTPYRVMEPGSQVLFSAFPGGPRFVYVSVVGGEFGANLATLIVEQAMSGTPTGDNDLNTTSEQTVSDTSGTLITVPAATEIDFPPAVPQAITVNTPVDPVTLDQLASEIDGVAVVRVFGPSGTNFSNPIPITITYTDAEVAGLDESELVPYLFNTATNKFDIPVDTVIARDTAANTLTFTVDHFSTFALVVVNAAAPAAEKTATGLLTIALVLATWVVFRSRRSVITKTKIQ